VEKPLSTVTVSSAGVSTEPEVAVVVSVEPAIVVSTPEVGLVDGVLDDGVLDDGVSPAPSFESEPQPTTTNAKVAARAAMRMVWGICVALKRSTVSAPCRVSEISDR
jgi:hypothetical protein